MTASTSTEPKVPAQRGGSGGGASAERERVSAFWSLSRAMLLGMKRDRTATFFILLFPLVFLVFFGSLGKGSSSPHAKVAQVGAVKLFDSMQGGDRAGLDQVLTITRTDDEAATLEKVRKGDYDAMIKQGPDGEVELRFSAADTVRAGAVQGVLGSVVQSANQKATGQPPAYVLDAQQVEDKSLKSIQFLTPGLLGWAVATGAVFGAALTLVGWRKSKVLRRLRLAPVSAGTVVSSRILVSLLTALLQTTVFLVVATNFFGLKLTGNWWLVIPLVACATLAFMSIGLLAGSVAKTEEAANGISQIIVLPMSFLSGAFFPMDGAPGWLKTVSEVMPLRYLVQASQSVLTRGGGVMDALPTMGGLLLFAAVLTGIAWKLFKWEDA
ncbi:ABC-2 type transport system permease protein [Kitasatospora sp. MAA19]|uniref:ABC transporter permease n=1 Tax=unclassified Kitasatospora TaxID=2633591 RepID=UPI00247578BB|nr:ABC transporter permease [Kitasatospora sp. MAA19]MDH6709400.1 ABC-2 type transport system permease protein [Kitasatospora sp. MAA19]